MRRLHRGGGDYDYYSHTPDAYYELNKGQWVSGYYNKTPDLNGRFGDRHKDTYWIERGFSDGLRDHFLFRPLLEPPPPLGDVW